MRSKENIKEDMKTLKTPDTTAKSPAIKHTPTLASEFQAAYDFLMRGYLIRSFRIVLLYCAIKIKEPWDTSIRGSM